MSQLADQLEDSLKNGIIDGKTISNIIREELKEVVSELPSKPFLATILVGDDPASQVYVKFKEKACNQIGINNSIIKMNKDTNQDDLESKINELNNASNINGILLQLPLPDHLDEITATMQINPNKDVDGLHYVNVGKLFVGLEGFIPCTPNGIIKLLKKCEINLAGLNAVIIGRSNLVGKPLIRLLERENATVTICHSKTKNLKQITKNADLIVAAIGKPKFITEDMIKDNSIIIDVGINRVDGKLVGDVDYENIKSKTKLITPVPGGVGPMTVTMLLWNTIKAYQLQNNLLINK